MGKWECEQEQTSKEAKQAKKKHWNGGRKQRREGAGGGRREAHEKVGEAGRLDLRLDVHDRGQVAALHVNREQNRVHRASLELRASRTGI